MLKQIEKDKRGITGGLVSGLIFGVGFLVIGVIVIFVITSTVGDAGLLTSLSAEDNATDRLRANLTEGIDNISDKIPTVLLVAAIVLILAVLAILVGVFQRMRLGGGSGGTSAI